jgi:hypothetical protein
MGVTCVQPFTGYHVTARIVAFVVGISGYTKTSRGSQQSFYGNSDFPITLF